jgi:hypothetical protein
MPPCRIEINIAPTSPAYGSVGILGAEAPSSKQTQRPLPAPIVAEVPALLEQNPGRPADFTFSVISPYSHPDQITGHPTTPQNRLDTGVTPT